MAINPDRPKFGAHPSDPPTDFEATAGEPLDGRDRFCGGQCGSVGHDEERGADADPLRRCGEPGERIEVAPPPPFDRAESRCNPGPRALLDRRLRLVARFLAEPKRLRRPPSISARIRIASFFSLWTFCIGCHFSRVAALFFAVVGLKCGGPVGESSRIDATLKIALFYGASGGHASLRSHSAARAFTPLGPGEFILSGRLDKTEKTGDSPADEDFISVRDVHLSFGARVVYDGLDCRLRKGGIHLILGGSGTGKSMLLRMIGGLQRPDAGEITVAGHRLREMRERDLGEVRRGIGMLFQNGALLDSMTVLENVRLPLREHTNSSQAEIAKRVSRVLTAVGLEDVESLLPRELSGGMLRRVAFARAIVMEPEILLCDEPFSGLDPLNVTRIENLLMELNRDLGLTIVITSHHMASSLRMADQMILLRDYICMAGSPEDLAGSQDEGVIDFLGEDGRSFLARLHELQDGSAQGGEASP